MKSSTKTTIMIMAISLMLILLALLLRASDNHRRQITCEGIRVEYADKYRFVSEDDIKDYLAKYYGSYVGQRLDSVDLCKIENVLDEQSAILKSEAYTTEDGLLNVRISQRDPKIRFQKGDNGFYVDERGYIFPLQDNFTSHVPVIDGDIPVSYSAGYKGKPQTPEEEAWINGIMDLMGYISKSKLWKEAFVQFHVGSDGGLTLVPRIGNEKFLFGRPDEFDPKFDRIAKYYEYIKPAADSLKYSTVNVKYDGQIICKK